MKGFVAIAAALIPIVCFAGAAVLAYYDKQGWGWMIFAGCFSMCAISLSVKA